MSKESFYFSHDYNSRTDDKIKKLIRKHGMAGYGLFWCLVEDLYNNANALQTDYEGIAYDLRTDAKLVESVITEFDLFCIDVDGFGSHSVERRLDERNKKSETARQSAFKRWNKIKADANAMQTHSDSNAIKEIKEIKEKKEKDIYIEFDVFWDLYDKKVDRKKSEYKWLKLSESDMQKCIEAIPIYIKSTLDKKFRKDPVTYLNNRSWENEIIEEKSNFAELNNPTIYI